MPPATVSGQSGPTTLAASGPAGRRRTPSQARSRERVARILDAASELLIDPASGGVDGLSTRSIADAAGLPVASLYQYFADKEAVLLAICERDMIEMDEQVATDLLAVAPASLDIGTLVGTAMRAFVKVYHRRPAFMQIWMRGRTNAAIYEEGRRHNKQIAADLLRFANSAGLVDAGRYSDAEVSRMAELAVEVGDRAFQLAFEHDARGDMFLVDQAIEIVVGYLRRVSTEQHQGSEA